MRRHLVAIAVLCLTATMAAGCTFESGPQSVVRQLTEGLPQGRIEGIGFVDSNGEPLVAGFVYEQAKQLAGELKVSDLTMAIAGDPEITDNVATVPVSVAWKVRGAEWRYQTSVRLKGADDTWRIIWSSSILHPDLQAGDKLAISPVAAQRASILDGAGEPLIKERPVVVVGIEPRRVTDQAELLADLSAAFKRVKVDVSLADLPARLAAASPDAFVEVVTLRREVYDQIRSDIRELPGTVFQEQRLLLAPTRQFARALLGGVGPARADQIAASNGRYVEGDQVGQSGLQEQYDEQLAGKKGFHVVIIRGASGENPPRLFTAEAVAGEPLKTTLDQRVQNAADGALASQSKLRSALVAIRISDGAVVAVANGPGGGELNLAFTATVPPGSTFKVVSALGLLDAGAVTANSPVACPKTYAVEGREFHNAGNFALGTVPFHVNFAKSCNTAFAGLARNLGPTGLDAAARSVGIGTAWKLGTDVRTGSVQTNPSAVESAAAAFGQGQTVVSPIALAAAAAAVARGSWTLPVLFTAMPAGAPAPDADRPAPPANGTALKPESVAALKAMMREVVTAGTATALGDVPGGPVYVKTGTAEYDNNPAHTHAWTIGWQGDIAFAVFVEKGGSSSATAVPIVESFLRALA